MTMQALKCWIALVLLCCSSQWAQAQRTLTFGEAQDAMRSNNLLLLAEQYNISAAEANVIQARIWELPVASGEVNLINPEGRRFLDAGRNGQKALAIQQLIYLGGKKKAEVEFAQSNVGIAQLQFEQLLRNLRLQLGQSFYTAFYDLRRLRRIDDQIHILDTLLSNYQSQTDKGNVPLKELVRLEALELNLRSNRTELSREILENRRILSLLTAIPDEITPQVPDAQLSERLRLPLMSRDSTISYAVANNLDYRTSQRIAESQELRLKWQRTLAVPDLTAGLSYDQLGGAFANQVNLTVGIPIPLWNRNRGNIKEAQARLTQSTYESTYKRSEIATLAAAQYDTWIQENKQLSNISPEILANLETVYQGMVLNFQRRNISLLEFTDFMESYNQSINQFNEIRKGWILAGLSLENTLNLNLF